MDVKQKTALLAIGSNLILLLGKLSVGVMMGSISVISDALHSGLDVIASSIAFLSVRISAKPADEVHKYGHGKFENLAAIVEALLILGVALVIIWNSVPRLFSDELSIESLELGMATMAAAAMVNWVVSSKLMKVAKEYDSPALEADAWHLRTDVYTSIAVFTGIVLIRLTGIAIIDPIVAICVALLILKVAIKLLGESLRNILDTCLPKEEEHIIFSSIHQLKHEYVEVQTMRTRKAGSYRHIDLQMIVPRFKSLVEIQSMCEELEKLINKSLPSSQILISTLPCNPSENCKSCQAVCNYTRSSLDDKLPS